MNYLSLSDVASSIKAGRPIEQFLPPRIEEMYTVLRWIRLERTRDGMFGVSLFEVFDEGNPEYLDLYSFSFVDPDNLEGNRKTFSSEQDANNYALTELGARSDKFVNAGVIQDEYSEFLRDRK